MCELPVPLVMYFSFPVASMPLLLSIRLVWGAWDHWWFPGANSQCVSSLSTGRACEPAKPMGLCWEFHPNNFYILGAISAFFMSVWVAFLPFLTKRHWFTTEAEKYPLDVMTNGVGALVRVVSAYQYRQKSGTGLLRLHPLPSALKMQFHWLVKGQRQSS